MSVTALPILVLLLDKMNILKSDIGIRALRYASFDDIAIWTVFAIILLDWGRVTRQIAFFALYLVSFILVRKLFVKMKQEDRFPAFLVWIIICALGADWSGLHYLVGGFLAGLAIDEKWIGHEVSANFRKYVLILIMPVFFLNTGLKTDWEINNPTIIILAIGLFAIQAFGKILGIKFASIFNKWDGREAITIGWLLQTKALIEIIFCTIMLDKGIITGQMFTALLFMAIISTTVTTPIVSKRIKAL
jgi:Kef-type K+ transport system membrane component KefB